MDFLPRSTVTAIRLRWTVSHLTVGCTVYTSPLEAGLTL